MDGWLALLRFSHRFKLVRSVCARLSIRGFHGGNLSVIEQRLNGRVEQFESTCGILLFQAGLIRHVAGLHDRWNLVAEAPSRVPGPILQVSAAKNVFLSALNGVTSFWVPTSPGRTMAVVKDLLTATKTPKEGATA